MDLLADAVKVTLGPKGRNVVIGRRFMGMDPVVSKDGVTVANVVDPQEVTEKIGADLIRSAAQKTVDTAGDGTTTSVVLAQAMLHAGFESLKSGASPIAVKRGMDKACAAIVEAVRKMAVPVTGEMVFLVANISANGDEAIGRIVAEAVEKIGKDGVVTVEESRTLETSLEIVNGLQLNSGFVSPYFITNPETMRCEYQDVSVLLWEGKLSSAKSLVPLMRGATPPLLIVAGDYEQEAIAILATNPELRLDSGLPPVRTGAFGDRRRAEILRDLAAITGEPKSPPRKTTQERKSNRSSRNNSEKRQKVIIDQAKSLIVGEGQRGSRQNARHPQADPFRRWRGKSPLASPPRRTARRRGRDQSRRRDRSGNEGKEKTAWKMPCTPQKAAVDEGNCGRRREWHCSYGQRRALPVREGHRTEEIRGIHIVCNACAAPLKQIAENAGLVGQGCSRKSSLHVSRSPVAESRIQRRHRHLRRPGAGRGD